MSTPKPLVSLATWARQTYQDNAPCLNTLRKWARDALIQPTPQLHGRAYFVDPDAKYVPVSKRHARRARA